MFTISSLAFDKLKTYLEQNKVNSAVRILPMQNSGCVGSPLGMALDTAKETDLLYEEGTLRFLVAEDLQERCGAITIDFIEAGFRSGFSITTEHPLSVPDNCCGGTTCGGTCTEQTD
ncbi:MAG: IscA/HesB family protein [Desulfobulbus sp.]|jgi:iron-sulfur cluster assembly protein